MSAEHFPIGDFPPDDEFESLYFAESVQDHTERIQELRRELRALMASWEYAYAMGHGCSLGDHPRHKAVRERVDNLYAQISELQGTVVKRVKDLKD